MRISVRRCTGYCIVAAGLLLLIVTGTRDSYSRWYEPAPITQFEFSLLLIFFGTCIIFAPSLARMICGYSRGESLQPDDGFDYDSVEERRRFRLPLSRMRSALADRGIVGGTLILLLLIPACILMHWTLNPYRAQGIYVCLPNQHRTRTLLKTTDSPIIVTILRRKDSFRLLLNGQEIRPEDMGGVLKLQFATRPDWTVFIEGDENLSYADVMYVINDVMSVHGKPVLLTPKMREESAAAMEHSQKK